MTLLRIEHALVMDTDHIPGWGGYALVSASPGVSQAQRRFVADHLGISDYLHVPGNARMYFSFFRTPEGRYAFVRRFASGTRRSGVQSRLFVHTLFLDDDAFLALHALPWLLADLRVRPVGANHDGWTSLGKLIDPEQRNAVMPALEIDRPPMEEAFASLQRRVDALGQLAASEPPLSTLDPKESIARVADAIIRSARVELPQRPAYELLTLLAWSVLPVPDRATTWWTQHADATAPEIDFGLANVPEIEAPAMLAVEAAPEAQRTVSINTGSASDWMEFCAMTRLHARLRWGAPDLGSWLEYRRSLLTLLSDPLAADDELLPRLRAVARSVRQEQRDPWVQELTILQFIWTSIMANIDRGTPSGAVVERWARLATESGIGAAVFREPPASQWLDVSEAKIGTDLVIQFFLAGSERFAAAATRKTVAQWALERTRAGARISSDALARIAVALAFDRSELLGEVLTALLGRADGFRALKSALPIRDRAIGDGVLLGMLTGLQLGHRDSAFFAKEVLLPHITGNPAMAAALPETAVVPIAEAMRADAAALVDLAFLLSDRSLGAVILAADDWVAQNGSKWMPLARLLLRRGHAVGCTGAAFTRLAFTVALKGETSETWLPTLVAAAKAFDAASQPATDVAFARKAGELAARFAAEPAGAAATLRSVRKQVDARMGVCVRALLDATRTAWPRLGELAADTIEAIVRSPHQRVAEWESYVLAVAETGSGPITAFWQRLSAYEVENLNRASIAAILRLRGDACHEIVMAWTPRLKSLGMGPNADVLIQVLRRIAVSDLSTGLEIAIARREIAHGIDTAATYARLDLALRAVNPRTCVQSLAETIEERLRPLSAAARVAWLIRLFAASCTMPTTAQVVEDRLLPTAVRKLKDAEWLTALGEAEESVFAFDYFLIEIARRVAASNAPEAARYLLRQCQTRGREAGTEALIVASKGALMPAAAGARSF